MASREFAVIGHEIARSIDLAGESGDVAGFVVVELDVEELAS